MGDKKNLLSKEAQDKIKELGMEIQTCMFCTNKGGKMVARPMSTQQIDDDGNVWFLSSKDSHKNHEITTNTHVDLLYAHGHDKFLSLHGQASISYDKQKIKELWVPLAKIWFTDGVDDPRISVIKIAVNDGYYWNTKHGKMVEFAVMAAAFVAGKTMDDGIEGKLKLS